MSGARGPCVRAETGAGVPVLAKERRGRQGIGMLGSSTSNAGLVRCSPGLSGCRGVDDGIGILHSVLGCL
eukprot:3268158-Rhodomonas_salina.1